MTRALDRRHFLGSLGRGAAGFALLGCSASVRPAVRGASASLPRGDELTELAERLRQAPRERAFDVAADAIRAGAQPGTLLGATFLAGIHDVRPQHVGGKLHCVMAIESYYQLIEDAPLAEAYVGALTSLDDLKVSQRRDERDHGDWRLSAAPRVRFADEASARAEFHAAMRDWDEERADRALVGLLPYHDRHSLFELLWPYGARSFVDIGHKIIFTAHVERVLARLDWRHAQPAMRSLVLGLLHGAHARHTNAWDETLERAEKLSARASTKTREAPAESAALLRALRGTTRTAARDVAYEALASGLGQQTVWDGLRLAAAETFLQRNVPSGRGALLPVHAVTVVNAFGYVARTTTNPALRPRLVLQAAAWLADLRAFLEGRGLLADDGPRLDELPESTVAPKRARLRTELLRQGEEHHQPKLAAAALEESGQVAPRWRTHVLAPVVPYLPVTDGRATEVHERATRALRTAGLESRPKTGR